MQTPTVSVKDLTSTAIQSSVLFWVWLGVFWGLFGWFGFVVSFFDLGLVFFGGGEISRGLVLVCLGFFSFSKYQGEEWELNFIITLCSQGHEAYSHGSITASPRL